VPFCGLSPFVSAEETFSYPLPAGSASMIWTTSHKILARRLLFQVKETGKLKIQALFCNPRYGCRRREENRWRNETVYGKQIYFRWLS
jgi:hypothetical protein